MRRLLTLLTALVACVATHALAWDFTGGDSGGQRFSPLNQINRANVSKLIPVWTTRTGAAAWPAEARKEAKFQATPILADDKLLACTPFNVVVALDPATGRLIWKHDPKIPTQNVRPANGFNCRGVSVWRDAASDAACAKRVFTGTNDGRLIALDLNTGAPCEGFGVKGEAKIDPGMPLKWPGEFQITSPPAIAGDVVIVGSAIGDNQRVAAPHGVVHAFDARTGALLWSFDPIPRDPADPAAASWKTTPPVEGHANVWSYMSVDAARGLVFLPTSSPSPDFYGGLRPGDNRYANSVVALDAKTGVVRWSFQTTHHDVWDYDVPAQPLLTNVEHDGKRIDAVIQVTKMGLVFTLNRDTGEPIFPVEERIVPQGGVEGEDLSLTQPFPTLPKPLSPTRLRPEDAYGFTDWDRRACAKKIASARSQGIYTPPSTQGTIVVPFTGGGANWGGAAFDASTQTLYVNTSSAAHLITLIPADKIESEIAGHLELEVSRQAGAPYGMKREILLSPLGLPCNPPPWGVLHAIDMRTGLAKWNTTLGTTEDLAPLGVALNTGTPNLGGPIVTGGGLVFIAASMDRYFRAFDAQTGKEKWAARLPAGGQAIPMTYEWKGRQYVVIAAGGHSEMQTPFGDYLVAYALPAYGEAGPGIVSRMIDWPGGRFVALMSGVSLALILAVTALVFFLLRRRRRYHH